MATITKDSVLGVSSIKTPRFKFSKFLKKIGLFLVRSKTINELNLLTDSQLKDIGIERSQIVNFVYSNIK